MYARTPYYLFLRDSPARMEYHVLHDDYFTHLATLMGFLEEALQHADIPEQLKELPRELRRDLRYMQANYYVRPRALVDVQRIPGKGNLVRR